MSEPISGTARKTYLGDGVYADVDPFLDTVKLTTENGIEVTNIIHLGMTEMGNLLRWYDNLLANLDRRRRT